MKKHKIWQFNEFNKEEAKRLGAEAGISPLVAGILLNRGITTAAAAHEFLYGSDEPFHDPFLMKDMAKSVERIWQAIECKERITVYGDYDVDGISASSLLYLFLKDCGADVNTYIPERKSEGYGLNIEALNTLHAGGTALVVTVDCGISAVKEIAGAPAGLDIIVTDHHTPPEVLPEAYALVNPHQKDCGYPFEHLSGVGVAFKLCQALYKYRHADEPLWSGNTEFVALGTVADIVPLWGENRALVKMGLKQMETTANIGLKALMEKSRCPQKDITSENIGFILAPRLNAVGRLEHAQLAVELLTAQDEARAAEIAEALNEENTLRQKIIRDIFVEAEAMLAQMEHIDTAIVLAKEGWHAGVIGIVASRLVDKYHLPTILISIDGDVAKGSCRSIPRLDLYAAINANSDLLVQFGGHHQAAGLTIKTANIGEFKRRFKQTVAQTLQPEDYLPVLNVDMLVDKDYVLDVPLLNELKLLEPFGSSNPAPLFAFKDAAVRYAKIFGAENTHLRFSAIYGGQPYQCLMWGGAENYPCMYNGAEADLVFMPKINVWQDRESVNLQVVDFAQKLAIYDYRNAQIDKPAFIKSLLQTANDILIYVNDKKAFLEAGLCGEETVREYGSTDKAKTIVLYDIPETDVEAVAAALTEDGIGCTLFLLYNNNDFENAAEALFKRCPNRLHLAEAYKKMAGLLKTQVMMNEAELLAACDMQEIYLTVFEELDFISRSGGQVSMLPAVKKNNLENSAAFRQAEETGRRIYRQYRANMLVTPQKIAGARGI